MKIIQFKCDLCGDVIMERTVPRQPSGANALSALCIALTKRVAYEIVLNSGANKKPKRMRMHVCPKCLYRLSHWEEGGAK